jgi:signal transduction histidine kinase
VRLSSQKVIASHSIYSMLGKEPFSEFFTVQAWKSFVHPEDLYKLIQAEEELLYTGLPSVAEYRLITQSGRHIFVDHHMYLTGSSAEQKIMSIIQDVTEQKSAAIIVDAMNESFFEVDENLAFRRVNEHASQFWHLEHQELVGKNLITVLPQADGTDFYNILLKALAKKIKISMDVIDPVTNHWLSLSATPYTDGLIVIFSDIQHEKEAEQKLQESNSPFQWLEELAQAGRWEYNVRTKEFLWSDGMYRLFGKGKKEHITPEVYLECALKDDLPLAKKTVDAIRENFEPIELSMRIKFHDSNRTIRIKAAPLKNGKGEVEKILGVDMDISQATQSEEKIMELNRSLFATNKELNSLNAELKTFTSIAASNYSETLRHLYINLEMIVTNDARNLSNSGRANLRRAQGAIQKMKLTTDDLLSFSRLHEIGVKENNVDLNVILEKVIEDFRKQPEHSLIVFNCDHLPLTNGYPLLLSLLFHHLMDNAIKFRKGEKGHIVNVTCKESISGQDIDHEGTEKNFKYHVISVEDNGIGFPQTEAEKIFKMFYRLHEKNRHKGSGTGLALCRKIMEMHGGFITAEGKPDEGASFNCYFPA